MFQKSRVIAAALILAVSSQAFAANSPEDVVAVTYVSENLNKGLDSWESKELRYTRKKDKTESLYLGVVEDVRYAETDTTVFLGGSTALRQGTVLSAEAGGGSNEILPQFYAKGGFSQELGNGLILNGGVKRTNYVDAHTVSYEAGVEKYIGKFRVAVDTSVTKPSFQAGNNKGYKLAVDYYPKDTVSVGAFAAKGKETEASPAGILSFPTTTFGVRGKLAITETVAISAIAAKTRYEGSYTRTTLGLALEFKF